MQQLAVPSAETGFWVPSSSEWLDEAHEQELVAALKELITELIGWGVEAA